MSRSSETHSYWFIVLLAAALLMVTMGSRQSQGLFLSPLNTSTGLGIATISLAMAIGQFVWGAVQPIAGQSPTAMVRDECSRVAYSCWR